MDNIIFSIENIITVKEFLPTGILTITQINKKMILVIINAVYLGQLWNKP